MLIEFTTLYVFNIAVLERRLVVAGSNWIRQCLMTISLFLQYESNVLNQKGIKGAFYFPPAAAAAATGPSPPGTMRSALKNKRKEQRAMEYGMHLVQWFDVVCDLIEWLR